MLVGSLCSAAGLCSAMCSIQTWDSLTFQDKLESVLDISHQQMEQYRDQPPHAEKIACQQRLLQEDLVHIRAEISRVSTVRWTWPPRSQTIPSSLLPPSDRSHAKPILHMSHVKLNVITIVSFLVFYVYICI